MAVTAFMNPACPPTPGEISKALGPSACLWEMLATYLSEGYGVEPTFVPPGRSSGWELKYRKGGRTLVSLTPDEGSFTALVVLGAAETAAARELELGDHVRKVFEGARQLHDGRWLFVRIESERDVADVEALVAVKRRPRVTQSVTRTGA